MLQKELAGIDAEIITNKWDTGLKKARGNYVCLLEKNSAVQPGTIRSNLDAFLTRPAYRKLAMVSPRVDLPFVQVPVRWSYSGELCALTTPGSDEIYAAKIGYAPGAVIRTSSLKKYGKLENNPYVFSSRLSVFFWENGLRVEFNPETLYYAPENVSYKKYRKKAIPSPALLTMWHREMIA
ncbi:MAG TPA: hypothetical protein VFL85_01520 [Candidatus Saccharimonadales bacterium]|nr:hypothetical protein [Candidatus Saccharimonadales bacterium]